MIVKQKDIILLQYPFSNFEGNKVRPAIIVSNDELNKKSGDCIVVPLTTVIKDEPYSIIINKEDLSSGSLIKQSRIRIDKISAIEKNLIVMKIGTANDKIFNIIKHEISKLFL